MALSGITAVTAIPERSEATPGLFNSRFDRMFENVQSLYTSVRTYLDNPVSTNTLRPESGNTISASTTALIVRSIDSGGAVFDIRAFGAVLDGVTDDTDAWVSAISAAQNALASFSSAPDSAVGAVVYAPAGRPTVRRPLTVHEGITIVGAGDFSTQVVVDLSSNTLDAFTWQLPSGTTNRYFYGGGLRDIDIYADTPNARDIVHLESPQQWRASGVRLYGGGRYSLYINDCIDTALRDVKIASSGSAGLFVEGSAPATTLRAWGLYVISPDAGPCVSVSGIGHVFDACIFESSLDTEDGHGFVLRSGSATLNGCYFENNRAFDVYAGSVGTATIAVINPYLGSPHASKTSAAVWLDRVKHAIVKGGDYSAVARTVEMTPNCLEVEIAAYLYPNEPLLSNGSHWRTKQDLFYNGNSDPAVGTYTHGRVITGGGTPESNITAPPGWVYQDISNGTLYVKQSGTTSIGWVAK